MNGQLEMKEGRSMEEDMFMRTSITIAAEKIQDLDGTTGQTEDLRQIEAAADVIAGSSV